MALRSVDTDELPSSGGPLSIYTYSVTKNRWARTPYANANAGSAESSAPSQIRVLTWNVNFLAPQAPERLRCILAHIQHVVLSCPNGEAPPPSVLLLQEIEEGVLPVLLADAWLRAHFRATPVSKWNWPQRAHYGNVSLVSHDVPVCAAAGLVFPGSHMARGALVVDVLLAGADDASASEASGAPRSQPVRFRIANTHLESLKQGAAQRPEQLKLVACALREASLLGGVVCGDMNAISAGDRKTLKEVGLVDAYLGSDSDADADSDDDAEGHTWGYQPACGFPPGRLDKVLHTGGRGFAVERPVRVGVGLQTADGQWASEHYGLLTTVSITRTD